MSTKQTPANDERTDNPLKTAEDFQGSGTFVGSKNSLMVKEVGDTPSRPDQSRNVDIAVIGMACRFADAQDPDEFWSILRNNQSRIKEIPEQRWDWRQHYGDPLTEPNKGNCIWGSFIDNAEMFDPCFFGVSALEAEMMDPQQRIMMELAWTCFEDAGIAPSSLSGQRVGVIIGSFNYDYKELLEKKANPIEAYNSIGTAVTMIPNRISHFFNFQGPSLALDAACSSSLVALHCAMQSLRGGECTMALAGGINLMLTSSRHISFSKTRMLSPTGACKTFDDNADGYVRGEGAGILLLKPLADALRDGNHIHGILKGSSIGHCGKTRTITYPNSEAQASVIAAAIRDARVSPYTIGYVEAHGTGTPKGDPIEFQGLTAAFQKLGEELSLEPKEAYCGLGSVKTNIGHLEAAAGVAGVIKVLLSFRHRQIPGLLHFTKLNHRIALDGTPFRVVHQLEDWRPLLDEEGREIPRRAGVSSFGFGGVNSHVILEEAPQEVADAATDAPYSIVCLSAQTEAALYQLKHRFLSWFKEDQEDALHDISVALALGREHMKFRAAYVVKDASDLIRRLVDDTRVDESLVPRESEEEVLTDDRIRDIEEDAAGLYAAYNFFMSGDQRNPEALSRQLTVLAGLYVAGIDVDWKRVFPGRRSPYLKLPTYPFAREPYWIPSGATQSPQGASVAAAAALKLDAYVLHPLVHQNVSDFMQQKFHSRFSGTEAFFRDHLVFGKKVLPGVSYLEIARKAVEIALGIKKREDFVIRMSNVLWSNMVVAETEPVNVTVGLDLHESQIQFGVYQERESGDRLVYASGTISVEETQSPEIVDIAEALRRSWNHVATKDDCYEQYEKYGLSYGESHRGIEAVNLADEEALARVVLPVAGEFESAAYVLNPSIMDSAFQAGISLLNYRTDSKSIIPFMLEEMEVSDRCPTAAWVSLRLKGDGQTRKVDMDLCDDLGRICVKMRGLHLRAWGEGRAAPGDAAAPPRLAENPRGASANEDIRPVEDDRFRNILLTPGWDIVPLYRAAPYPAPTDRVIVIGGTPEDVRDWTDRNPNASAVKIRATDSIGAIANALRNAGNIDHLVWIAPPRKKTGSDDEALVSAQETGVIQIFKIIKAMLALNYGNKDLGWTAITRNTMNVGKVKDSDPSDASIQGLIGTLANEYPHWRIRLVDVDAGARLPIGDIISMANDFRGNLLLHRNRVWFKQQLFPVVDENSPRTLYRDGGVYVVIGGAGGIGEMWSAYMIKKFNARIIWIGRRPKDADIEAKIKKLGELGEAPQYYSADARDLKSLEKAYQAIKTENKQIHGIIHSAIVLEDQALENMSEETFRNGLRAKTDICVRIAQVFKNESPDFVVFFSSILSYLKTAGQANYTSGCTFKDAFGERLAYDWKSRVKVINWGYWGSIGIVASKAYQERMRKNGFGSIDSGEAMEAMERFLAGPLRQMTFMKASDPGILNAVNDTTRMTICSSSPGVNLT